MNKIFTQTPEFKFNDTAVAQVESLNHEGQGVARVHGKAVFIRGALPGEEVQFRYFNKRKNYDTGGVVEILQPSPDRIDYPKCRYFGTCGGCSLQHLKVEAQIRAKQQTLLDNLARIGKVTPANLLPPITGPAWNYRRKARLGVRVVPKKGGVLVGFRESRSSYITNLDICETLDRRIALLLPQLRRLISKLSCPERIPQIEVAAGGREAALVFRHLQVLTREDLNLLTAFGEEHALQIYLQPAGPDSVQPLWPPTPAPLSYALPDYNLELVFAPTDFIQINDPVNQRMIAQALELLDPQPHERALDLFCGLGNFSLPLARRAGSVLGVEGNALLVEKARYNAQQNAITNAEFQLTDLYAIQEAEALPWQREKFDKWLLDPPRTGALEVIKSLPQTRAPARIVYISCYPATLARDSEVLVHLHGYQLHSAGVMDMFPHTNHVESIALFVKQ
ncbi:MAG TPA: 23S rRNA (uracil(1939)-C(5))-methyltransferase RlmD [Acidiferrobacterales bacterium]|nr:23S rRNA (uracil(1939)-C(5))-methyltransferase RlmD [Acidiferrobacterales bacterium]